MFSAQQNSLFFLIGQEIGLKDFDLLVCVLLIEGVMGLYLALTNFVLLSLIL
jgi:hypothetical protein